MQEEGSNHRLLPLVEVQGVGQPFLPLAVQARVLKQGLLAWVEGVAAPRTQVLLRALEVVGQGRVQEADAWELQQVLVRPLVKLKVPMATDVLGRLTPWEGSACNSPGRKAVVVVCWVQPGAWVPQLVQVVWEKLEACQEAALKVVPHEKASSDREQRRQLLHHNLCRSERPP